jgi:UDP-N-acetylmuramyl pentapeptide synthase
MAELGMEAEPLEVYHHAPSVAGFDLIVAPVHLRPANPALVEARRLGKRIQTHHEAVGELLAPPFPVFEVTGTHSKTSTALLLSRILSKGQRVISHSTRGIELWSGGVSRLLESGLSIAPANIIRAAETAESQGADALVCEVSLGGTGLADYGIMTSLKGDYRIAGGSMWASTAKLQMASLAKPGSILIANVDAKISPDISFGEGGNVQAAPDKLCLGREALELELGEDIDFSSYETAISAAAAAAHASGVEAEAISAALEGFDGFFGRMKVVREEGLLVCDNSNSGLKLSDVERALDCASGGRLGLVVGEEAATVCEGIDVEGLVDLLRRRRVEIEKLVLVGRRLEPWAGELGAATAKDLASGARLARADGLEELVLCVKCFR